jgi:hypothetical protein
MNINQPYIPAFWYSSNNFGDSLTHYLIKKISGRTPILVAIDDPCEKVMVTGSILNNEAVNAIVWGCGLAFSTDTVPEKKQILAVRGKLTGEILKKQGTQFNEVYGDPCLLLPRIYDVNVPKRWTLGILPHYVDTKLVYDKLGLNDSELGMHGIKILDIMSDVENVIQQVKSCEKVISSTLHGLIVCHAYGIPCEWVKFSDNIGGDDFKYLDYFSSINSDKKSFFDLRGDKLQMETLRALANYSDMKAPLLDIDLNALWNCCPFRY